MESQNSVRSELAFRIQRYLEWEGKWDSFVISKFLLEFSELHPSLTDLASGWIAWERFYANKIPSKTPPLPLPNREWQFGSMVPMTKIAEDHITNKKPTKLDPMRPILVLLTILFWSLLYYYLLTKLI